jgi:hypothetical protein
MNREAFRGGHAHHDGAVRAEDGNFLRRAEQIGEIRQSLGVHTELGYWQDRVILIRRWNKEINAQARAAPLGERRRRRAPMERRDGGSPESASCSRRAMSTSSVA